MKIKFSKAIIAVLIAVFCAVGFIGCDEKVPNVGGATTTQISLDKEVLSLEIGGEQQLTATVNPSAAAVAWRSSDATVATVRDGTVTALATGSAIIAATAGGATAVCLVKVEAVAEVPVTVTLNQSSVTMPIGSEQVLEARVTPSGTATAWHSSDTAVATVADGKVKSIAAGATIISATAGDKTAICLVKVEADTVEPATVKLDKTSLTLAQGVEQELTATVTPSDSEIEWSSSDTSVATVLNGKVTANAAGAVLITAKVDDSIAVCLVVVEKSSNELVLDSADVELTLGEVYSIKLSGDADVGANDIVWATSNPEIATVKDGRLMAHAVGNATITVIIDNDVHLYNVHVGYGVAASMLGLNQYMCYLDKGDECKLEATVEPSSMAGSIIWYSTDSSVVRVVNGKLTAVADGTAYVYAIAGGRSVACLVYVGVEAPPSSESVVLPMTVTVGGTVYSDDRLVYWQTLDLWQWHTAIDFIGAGDVYAIKDGTVIDVEKTTVDGGVITIEHSDGYVSVYKSVADVTVKVGDKVKAGDKIAVSSDSMATELCHGAHLHLEVKHNGQYINPANILPIPKHVIFTLPMTVAVGGTIYADDKLVYWQTLDLWQWHPAIDFIGEGDVYAIGDGTVIEVDKTGVITIEHSDGYVSVYKSVADVTVKVGDTVKAGDKIAVSSDSMMTELCHGAHLHLEVKHNGQYINPASVLPLD